MKAKIRALVTGARCNIIFTYVTKNRQLQSRSDSLKFSHAFQYSIFVNSQIYREYIYAPSEGTLFFSSIFFKAQKNVREYFLLPVSCFSLVFLLLAFFLRPFFSRSSKVNWIEKSGCMEAVHVITEKKSTTALVMSDFLLHQKTGRTPRLGQVYVQFRSIKLKSHFKGGKHQL